ncbi:hypothetical protein ACIQMV_37865 [Streptomyces sp. NPDC091412]|uniref:hypothetical protein n=1 Tax=Streptomyces sp. NPDC091412 TaxID=3366002 RepID=UPI0037FB1829
MILGSLVALPVVALQAAIFLPIFLRRKQPDALDKWLESHVNASLLVSLKIIVVACAVGYMVFEMFGDYLLNPRETGSKLARFLMARRYALVSQCAEAIHACSEVRRGGQHNPARFRKLSKRLKTVRRGILSAHHSRGTVPRRSHRTLPLKHHERRVSAALMKLETKLDLAPNEALREIAEALLTISDRYCEGRVGEFLDDQQLTSVPPQRNWEALRYLAAFVLAGGGIAGLATTGAVPESAETYVYGSAVGAACVIAFGRNFRRALDVVSTITGGS